MKKIINILIIFVILVFYYREGYSTSYSGIKEYRINKIEATLITNNTVIKVDMKDVLYWEEKDEKNN